MRISGTCDFCGKTGDWEGGIYDDPEDVKNRPKDWAGFFPTKIIPVEWLKLNWASPEFCEEHDIITKFACPKCYRKC